MILKSIDSNKEINKQLIINCDNPLFAGLVFVGIYNQEGKCASFVVPKIVKSKI